MVVFTLFLKDDVNEDGTLKEGANSFATSVDAHKDSDDGHDHHDETKALQEARDKLGPTHEESQTSPDDVD